MSHFSDIVVELFKRDEFTIITDHENKAFEKQKQAFKYLTDKTTDELLFGGGAGGSKSFTGWMWETLMCLSYDETFYFVARNTLKDLRLYGMQSFTEVKNFLQLDESDYKFNAQDNYIEFQNKSKIYLLECRKKPSDTEFHGLGSSLFTSGFIEEAGEVHFDAYDTLCSRVNRWKNDQYNIHGKIFITCNPSHNWLYTEFYKKSKNNTLSDGQKYLAALAVDNPYCPSEYISRLGKLKDKNKKSRLLYGDWEYDDDPSALCDYDAICDIFTNTHVKRNGNKYMSADLAMQGRDRFVAGSWEGFICRIPIDKEKSGGKEIEQDLKREKEANGIPNSRIVADSDGLGAYLESYIRNIKEFHGGSSARDKKQFANIKTECAYKLAEIINNRNILVICTKEQEESIKDELSTCLKADSVNKDESKKRIISKDKMKTLLGRSPDYMDMLLMRMIFEIKKTGIRSSGLVKN